MRLKEIKNFYQNASVQEIQQLLEHQDTQGMNRRILAEVIHAGNHDEVWTTWQTQDLLESVRSMAEQAHERYRSQD